MCGILSYYNKNGIQKIDIENAKSSLNIIKHRGPDGEGLVLINTKTQEYKIVKTNNTPEGIKGETINDEDFNSGYDLLLGHRRLSIFDLSINGHQPLFYQEQIIVFNGEIYNFIELKEELVNYGFSFSTGTDTEVIIAAYNYWGEQCFSKFNGMWSLVIYDFNTGNLIVSNDRFGVKPLYYYNNNNSFILMSEPKQIMAFTDKIEGINSNVVNVFMDTGYLFYNDETFFKNIFRFPVASYYKFNPNLDIFMPKQKALKFYKIPEAKDNKITEKEAINKFKILMADAVKVRLRSDVKWGISLSGGLDSTSIAFVAKEVLNHNNFITFSVVSEKGSAEDESYFINIANEKLQSDNIQINPLNNFDKKAFLDQIYQIGSPVTDTTFFAQYAIKKVINNHGVKVLLSGQGGDEILAGYHHHFFKYTTELLLKGKFITYINEIKKWAFLKGKSTKNVFKSSLLDAYLSKKSALGLAKFQYPFQQKIFATSSLRDYLKIDLYMLQLPYFLHADDSFSMAYSLETRNPFLDYRLVDFVFTLPNKLKIKNGWQKWLLREAINEMPNEIRYRTDKKGFSTPMKSYIEKNAEMLNYFAQKSDKLYPNHANKPLFKRAALGAWIENFIE